MRSLIRITITSLLLIGCEPPMVDCVCEYEGTVYELEFKKLERCTETGGTAICVEQ